MIVFIAVIAACIVMIVCNAINNVYIKPLRHKKAMGELREKFPTPIICTNSMAGVTGVCLASEFDERLKQTMCAVKLGSSEAAEEITIQVPATYTFYLSQDRQRAMHTGPTEHLETMFAAIVLDKTGKTIQYWKNAGCGSDLSTLLIKKDRRLFVPFATKAATANQLVTYSEKQTLQSLYIKLGLQ